jgi:hypothetical protein
MKKRFYQSILSHTARNKTSPNVEDLWTNKYKKKAKENCIGFLLLVRSTFPFVRRKQASCFGLQYK